MKLLLPLLLFCLPFNGSNGGKELLDKALERCERLETLESYRDILSRYRSVRQAPARLSPERQVQEEQRLWHPDPSHNRQTQFPFRY